jgi:hypothetical protein
MSLSARAASWRPLATNANSSNIYGGSGNNAYNVQSTPSGSATTLNTGGGVDMVNVRGTAGPLFKGHTAAVSAVAFHP